MLLTKGMIKFIGTLNAFHLCNHFLCNEDSNVEKVIIFCNKWMTVKCWWISGSIAELFSADFWNALLEGLKESPSISVQLPIPRASIFFCSKSAYLNSETKNYRIIQWPHILLKIFLLIITWIHMSKYI